MNRSRWSRCPICLRSYDPGGGYALICRLCGESLRRVERKDGTVFASIVWAANRARRFARKRPA